MSDKDGNPSLSVEIDGPYLVIRIPMNPPRPSASGKTLVVASTNGNIQTTAMIDGKPITVGANCYVRKEA